MPNKMNFLILDFQSEANWPILNIFIQNSAYPHPNTIYAVYRKDGIVNIDVLRKDDFNSKAIASVINDFYGEKIEIFIQDSDPRSLNETEKESEDPSKLHPDLKIVDEL